MSARTLPIRFVALALGVVLAACSTPLTTREKGALAGGAIGAGTGAIIGSQVGHTGAGALIGAGVGALSGVVIGDAIQSAEQQRAAQPAPPPPPPAPAPVVVAPPPSVVVAPPPVVAAPPPIVVSQTPQYIWVPAWNMYVLDGQDVVYYSGHHYYVYGERWYVAQAYGGPWVAVAAPPPAIVRLPRGHLHRHLPPGLARRGAVHPGQPR